MAGEQFADIMYRGLDLGTRLRVLEIDASFARIEHPAPMPVGTEIALILGDANIPARVTHVYEQVTGADTQPGMRLALLESALSSSIEQARSEESVDAAATGDSSGTHDIATAPTRELDMAAVTMALKSDAAPAVAIDDAAPAVAFDDAGEPADEPASEPADEPADGIARKPTQILDADEIKDALREHIEAASQEDTIEESPSTVDADTEEATAAGKSKRKRRKKRARTRGS